MTPRWLFFPTQSASTLLDFSGTFDANYGAGSFDNDPTISTPASFVSTYTSFNGFAVRSGSNQGVEFNFTSGADGLQFASDFPDDGSISFSLYLSRFSRTYNTNAGWSWTLTNSNKRVKIVWGLTEWDATDSLSTALTGTSFTIEAS